jgi:hypothetical protein
MESSQRPRAKDLPCALATLVSLYRSRGLKECETKKSQTKRHASSKESKNGLQTYHDFFPELVEVQAHLEDYSLCERHYNQLIASDLLRQSLLNPDQIYPLRNSQKRFRHSIDNSDLDSISNPRTSHEIGIQVGGQPTREIGVQVCTELTIQDLKNCIHLLQIEISDLQKQLDHAYDYVVESWERDVKAKKINQTLREQNNVMAYKWETRFNSQAKRINAIVQIAKQERQNVYDDIESLILNKQRFSLDNLLNYTSQDWLVKRNSVIINFIETLTYNNLNPNDPDLQEKIFKRAVAVDAIYGSRHGKYVSEINLAASAIKYSLARSKTIIDIDNHIVSSGSYTKFINWMESLAVEQEPLPEGLLFLAFDNEQRGQHNYLDRGYNTVIYHTVTSFVAFNMNKHDQTQFTVTPWLYNSLTSLQYKELHHSTLAMETECEQELHIYLSLILEELITEKKSRLNPIDLIVKNQKGSSSQSKWCNKCNATNIDNRKRNCPHCGTKLASLAALQAASANKLDQVNNIIAQSKPLIIRSHTFIRKPETSHFEHISITQKSSPDQGIILPEMYVPDPLAVNPNSINNVKKILEHIQVITGVDQGTRKWVPVTCDGVPYNLAQKIKKDFPWLILIPGALHEEMNMLKAFVELNWYYFLLLYLFLRNNIIPNLIFTNAFVGPLTSNNSLFVKDIGLKISLDFLKNVPTTTNHGTRFAISTEMLLLTSYYGRM